MPATTRLALPYPLATDQADVPADIHALASAIDGAAIDSQGTLAGRPVSTPGSPGIPGRYYMIVGDLAAPTENGHLYRDNGVGWNLVGGSGNTSGILSARPAAAAAGANGFYYATDADVLYRSTGTAWTRIGSQAGDLFLTMNATPAVGRITLSGQNWPATTGIYADLWAQWAVAWPTKLPDTVGRMPIVKGSHATVDAIGKNDGLLAQYRTWRHRHTPHSHTTNANVTVGASGSGVNVPVLVGPPGFQVGSTGLADGGSGTPTDPLDGPAYFVMALEAKL